MRSQILILTALAFTACSAAAEQNIMTEPRTLSATPSCKLNLSLQNKAEISNWRTVLDGVMGGRSTGNRFAENGHMVFKGSINTNGGGFSSIRRPMSRGDMQGAEALLLRIKQDDRTYRLTFRTNARFRGRSISYQLPIPKTPQNEWAQVTVTLKDFRTSIFGREIPAPKFDPNEVREIGIILADGIDGPFQIEVAEISCVQPRET